MGRASLSGDREQMIRRLSVIITVVVWGMLAQSPIPITPLQIIDTRSGVALPCVGCQLFTYAAGTTTPLATYTDSSLATANSNPVLTNAAGYTVSGSTIVGVFLPLTACYKFLLEDSSNVTIWTQDNICYLPATSSLTLTNLTISGTLTANGAVTGTHLQSVGATDSPSFVSVSVSGSILPSTAAGAAVGSLAKPFSSIFIGPSASNGEQILAPNLATNRIINLADQGTAGAVAFGDQADATKIVTISTSGATTGTNTTLAFSQSSSHLVAFPDASFTVSGAKATECGTAAGACAGTNIGATVKIIRGTATASSGTPSTVSITGMTPTFTASTTYSCFAEDATNVANVFQVLTAGYVSTSAVTFSGPASVTDVIRWTCIGY